MGDNAQTALEALDHITLGRLEERQRLARAIHDDPVQGASAIALRLGLLSRVVDPSQRKEIQEIQDTATQVVLGLRALMLELEPGVLGSEGLGAAVRSYLAQAQELHGLEAHLSDSLGREPEPRTRALLFAVVQEGVTNARLHSGSPLVAVTLEEKSDRFLVTVKDTGSGFDPGETTRSSSLAGLAGLRRRLELPGGSLSVTSGLGDGTAVVASVPAAAG
jgi:signal transduction histidine kinase